jgi:inosine-uridine nucleoside N-ribohydrolase
MLFSKESDAMVKSGTMMKKTFLYTLLYIAVLSAGTPLLAQPRYPIVYSTDLYYTVVDPDDHFDAAVLLKSPELDIKGVILDNHIWPTNDGEKVMAKLMQYANRQVPVVKGLGLYQVRGWQDQALYIESQGGVELILKTLKESKEKVELMAVGSMTDLAVAYLRDADLFMRKVANVYIAAGSSESPEQDYNVRLDPRAFVVLMRSKLPIVWIPVDSSMWYFPAPQMLVPEKNLLSHFLLNELLSAYLLRPGLGPQKPGERFQYYDKGTRMWSTPGFVHAIHHPKAAEMFDLVPCKVQFDDRGVMTNIDLNVKDSNIQVVKNINGDKLNDFIVERISR